MLNGFSQSATTGIPHVIVLFSAFIYSRSECILNLQNVQNASPLSQEEPRRLVFPSLRNSRTLLEAKG